MKITSLIPLAMAVLISSCSTPIQSRVERHPEMFAKLNEADKSAVRMGRIREGMSKDAVFLAWGRPSQVAMGKKDGKTFERWRYQDYAPVYSESYGMGVGMGYWGRHGRGVYYDPYLYGAPSVSYVPVDGRFVEFVNDKVTSFLAPVRR